MPRQPDFHLKALDKDTDKTAKIGAAWQNENGTISLVLNPFVVLNANDDLLLTLFPADEK